MRQILPLLACPLVMVVMVVAMRRRRTPLNSPSPLQSRERVLADLEDEVARLRATSEIPRNDPPSSARDRTGS